MLFNQWRNRTPLLLGCYMVQMVLIVNFFFFMWLYNDEIVYGFTGMKSLVNWPANENHKLPEYQGSEKDVFKVICDYFTNASSPLSTFYLYNILVEAFIRSEAADLTFRKPNEPSEDREDDAFSLHSRDSARGLVLEMASPIYQKTSTPIGTFLPENQDRYLGFS